MGTLANGSVVTLALPKHETFTLRFTRNRGRINTPETFRFQETILQSAIRRHLVSGDNLHMLLSRLYVADAQPEALEVLGEKALTQGHIDLLLKPRTPIGTAIKIPIEVKTDRGQPEDLVQLRGYMDELSGECPMGILIASDFNKKTVAKAPDYGIKLVGYSLATDMKSTPTFQDIHKNMTLQPLEK